MSMNKKFSKVNLIKIYESLLIEYNKKSNLHTISYNRT
jgi:hypothetical protein